jgi:hypothetical protein
VTSLEEDNLIVIYYPSASEIWPENRGGLVKEWRDTIVAILPFLLHFYELVKMF